jgi:hypothetical protein
VQGLGGAVVLPLSLTILTTAYMAQRFGAVFAVAIGSTPQARQWHRATTIPGHALDLRAGRTRQRLDQRVERSEPHHDHGRREQPGEGKERSCKELRHRRTSSYVLRNRLAGALRTTSPRILPR